MKDVSDMMCAAGCLKAISAAVKNISLAVCFISWSNCDVTAIRKVDLFVIANGAHEHNGDY